MRHMIVIASVIMLVACGGESMTRDANRNTPSIAYFLPHTRLNVGLDLVLIDCNDKTLFATPSLMLSPVAVAGPERILIAGTDLASASQKRDLAIQLYDNGTLKSVNTLGADRSFAIVGNLIKFATGVAKFAVMAIPRESICNPDTETALAHAKAIDTRLRQLRVQLDSETDPERLATLHIAIEALASELAAQRTGPLRLELRRAVDLPMRASSRDRSMPATVELQWNPTPFEKWLRPSPALTTDATNPAGRFALKIRFIVPRKSTADAPSPDGDNLENADDAPPQCRNGPCPALAFRDPVPVVVEVLPVDSSAWPGHSQDELLSRLSIPVAQWGQRTYLPIGVRVGDSRSVKLEFDAFGRKTSFTWSSEARAEAVTAGLSQATDALVGLRTALNDPDPTPLQLQLAKITELEALQKYNRLIKCEEILRAGGHVCPP